MKDFIFANYNFVVNKIFDNYFFVGDEKVLIEKYYGDIKVLDELYRVSNLLYFKNKHISTFLLNKENLIYTKKDNYYIILLKINDRESYISLNYLLNEFIDNKLPELNLINKISDDIDSFEEKLQSFNSEFKLLQDSCNYFIGMSENAIELLNEYSYVGNDIVHNISFDSFNIESINNPLYLVKSNKLFDITNYIKYCFFKKVLDYDELYLIIKSLNSEYEECVFFSLMMFSNYYFDMANKIISKEYEEKKINLFINSIEMYRELLIYCKSNLKQCKTIQMINWL